MGALHGAQHCSATAVVANVFVSRHTGRVCVLVYSLCVMRASVFFTLYTRACGTDLRKTARRVPVSVFVAFQPASRLSVAAARFCCYFFFFVYVVMLESELCAQIRSILHMDTEIYVCPVFASISDALFFALLFIYCCGCTVVFQWLWELFSVPAHTNPQQHTVTQRCLRILRVEIYGVIIKYGFTDLYTYLICIQLILCQNTAHQNVFIVHTLWSEHKKIPKRKL